jgi:hypothetical protein
MSGIHNSASEKSSELINTENGRAKILVIPTSEETMIARHCTEMLRRWDAPFCQGRLSDSGLIYHKFSCRGLCYSYLA